MNQASEGRRWKVASAIYEQSLLLPGLSQTVILRSNPRSTHEASWHLDLSKRLVEPTDSGPRSPAQTLPSAALLPSDLEPPPAKPALRHPPIPLFKIPPAQWPIVLQRVAQGESLRQIARSYHTSHEVVRRVLSAARKGLLAHPDSPADLHSEDAEEGFSKA